MTLPQRRNSADFVDESPESADSPPTMRTPPALRNSDSPTAAAPGPAMAPSWMDVQPDQYDELLAEKVASLRSRFSHLFSGKPDVFASPPTHFRHRCRFVLARLAEPGSRTAAAVADRPL